MRFYDPLFISDKIQLTRDEVLRKLQNGDTFFHTYLIGVPLKNTDTQIEYFHTEMSKQEYFMKEEYLIVGIAFGKIDASEMVHTIIHKVYEETSSTDIQAYFLETN